MAVIYQLNGKLMHNVDGNRREMFETLARQQEILDRADLKHLTLYGGVLDGLIMENCVISESRFKNVSLICVTLHRCNLRAAAWTDCDLLGADLTGSVLRYADLTYCDLTDAVFTGADLTGATLTGATYDPMALMAAASLEGVVW